MINHYSSNYLAQEFAIFTIWEYSDLKLQKHRQITDKK